MTNKQLINYAIAHAMTPDEIDNLASQLAASPSGRRAAGKAIAKGKRRLSDEVRQRKAQLIAQRNRERAYKLKPI